MHPGRPSAFVISCIATLALGAGAYAQSSNQTVSLLVDSVLAANTNEGVDTRLILLKPRLQALFPYTTYRLISHDEREAAWGQIIVFDLPGGHILHIEPRDVNGDMVTMEIVLFQGERPMMSTDLKLPNRGVLMVAGPRYEHGMLIISIAARAPEANSGGERGAPLSANLSPSAPGANKGASAQASPSEAPAEPGH